MVRRLCGSSVNFPCLLYLPSRFSDLRLRIKYFAMSDGRIVDRGEMKLMLPPPPRPPKVASTPQQQVLDEDTYTSDIEAIIE